MAERAVCKCDPSSDCGDNCMNRHMNYICGKDCPTGDRCTNKSLTRRPQKAYRIVWVSHTSGWQILTERLDLEGSGCLRARAFQRATLSWTTVER